MNIQKILAAVTSAVLLLSLSACSKEDMDKAASQVTDTVDAVAEKTEAAADAAGDMAADVAEATGDAIGEAAEAAEGMADDAMDAAGEMAEDASAAVEGAASDAADDASAEMNKAMGDHYASTSSKKTGRRHSPLKALPCHARTIATNGCKLVRKSRFTAVHRSLPGHLS